MTEKTATGIALLRVPFPAHQISKLPKPTKKQTDDLLANRSLGIRCEECGGWHHKDVVHLDYVGHAALTDRLLDCDPYWNWEPAALNSDGTPLIDAEGGMWIKLTVCGVTRLGYGHADGKRGGNAIKETIGDALRNAAMRFGAALDLWHKGDLHDDSNAAVEGKPAPPMSEGLKDAWKDAVLDSLPENATPRQAAMAFAKAICESFAQKSTMVALNNEWERRKDIIERLRDSNSDLFDEVSKAYDAKIETF